MWASSSCTWCRRGKKEQLANKGRRNSDFSILILFSSIGTVETTIAQKKYYLVANKKDKKLEG